MEEVLSKFNESDRVVYLVTRSGSIFSKNKKSGKLREIGGCIKKTCKWDKQGYKVFSIKNKQYHVHQVVAKQFIKKPKTKLILEVNHIDGNKHNNSVKNLEWVTRSENMKHAHKNNLIRKSSKLAEKNPNFNNFKDPIDKIASAFWYIDRGHTIADSARFAGVDYKRFFRYNLKRKEIEKRYEK